MVAFATAGAHDSTHVTRRRKTVAKTYYCDWCGERFKPTSGKQKYCRSYHSQLASERRVLETVAALTAAFAPYGVPADWLTEYAEKNLNAAKRILGMLGMTYSESRRQWERG